MPYQDWTFYKTDSAMLAAPRRVAPLVGQASLAMARNAVATANLVCNAVLHSPNPHGFTQGILRTLVRLDKHDSTSDHGMGLAFMQSQADLTAGGACYGAMLHTGDIGGTVDSYRLVKYTGGILAPTTNILAQESGLALALGLPIALEVEWRLDLQELGGIEIVGRRGSATNYTDLVDVWTATLTTAVLQTTVGEGLCVFMAGTGDHDCVWDETTLFEKP